MKKTIQFLIFLAVFVTAESCSLIGKQSRNDYRDGPPRVIEVEVDDMQLVIYKDDHTRTRKNADKIFNSWADKYQMRKMIKRKQLVTISVQDDCAVVTYNYSPLSGKQQKIVFYVNDFMQNYYKKRKL